MTKTLKKSIKIFLLILSILIFALFILEDQRTTAFRPWESILNAQKENPNIEKSTQQSPSPTPQDDNQNKERSEKIYSNIQSALENSPGGYSVYIKNLKNNQTFEYKSREIFTSASIYKLAVMYKTFDALKKGELEKDSTLSKTLASGEKISYSVSEALRLMITISDNESAILIAEKLGWANIEKFLKEEGIENFKLAAETQATAESTAQILEQIYRGEAVSKSASSDMKSLLLAQTVNDRIPKYLPKNIKVAHKTGELETIRHDAGIVYGKKSDYIFVFFSDTQNPEIAAETIAQLSKEIYNSLETIDN